ncbi:MAG: hypothetical protein ABIR62_00750, partial [Dokdonella sp.]
MGSLLHNVVSAGLALMLCACQSHRAAPTAPSTPGPSTTAVAKVERVPVVPSADGHTSGAITAEDFAARLEKVSSDAFEGRKPATMGERLTTAWIRDQFERMGVKPGVRGEWFQRVPVVAATTLDAANVGIDVDAAGGKEHLAYGLDMVMVTRDARP